MRLENRISNLEKKVKPKTGNVFAVSSEEELEKLLKERPELRFKPILIVPPAHKGPRAGM